MPIQVVTCASIAALSLAIRLLASAGSLVLMLQVARARHYTRAMTFGVVARQRALAVSAAVPFVASLTWRNAKLVSNE